MVGGFLYFSAILFLLTLLFFHVSNQAIEVAQIHSEVNRAEVLTLNLIKTDNDYFDLDLMTDKYFMSRKSFLLDRRDSLKRMISATLADLIEKHREKQYNVYAKLIHIDSTLKNYHARFASLEAFAFEKGFKDYGIEGKMRYHAHVLEDVVNENLKEDVLYLRRHEKDFLLRNDKIYLDLFEARSQALRVKLIVKNDTALHHLNSYHACFFKLVEIQQKIGLNSFSGLRNDLNRLTSELSNSYLSLSEFSFQRSIKKNNETKIYSLTLLVAGLALSLASAYWISKRLSSPIAQLSRLIRNSLDQKTTLKTDFRLSNAADEIVELSTYFNTLITTSREHLTQIKTKTKLLRAKNLKLKKLNKELDGFFYSTAHDLRSPLASILGLVNIIKKENHQPELLPYYDMMEKSIHRLESFIEQIVSHSQNKRTALAHEPLAIRPLIEEVFENHQYLENFERIEKSIAVSGDVFYSDRYRITLLLSNLVSNAIKYIDLKKDSSFIKIKVRVDREKMILDFEDNGIGIEQEHVSKIFKMFYRANHHAKGSGLGLFIFKETLNKLQGKVRVTSTFGEGCHFRIQIPNRIETEVTNDVIPFRQPTIPQRLRKLLANGHFHEQGLDDV